MKSLEQLARQLERDHPEFRAVNVTAGQTAAVRVQLKSDTIVLEAFTVSTSKEGMAQAIALQAGRNPVHACPKCGVIQALSIQKRGRVVRLMRGLARDQFGQGAERLRQQVVNVWVHGKRA